MTKCFHTINLFPHVTTITFTNGFSHSIALYPYFFLYYIYHTVLIPGLSMPRDISNVLKWFMAHLQPLLFEQYVKRILEHSASIHKNIYSSLTNERRALVWGASGDR